MRPNARAIFLVLTIGSLKMHTTSPVAHLKNGAMCLEIGKKYLKHNCISETLPTKWGMLKLIKLKSFGVTYQTFEEETRKDLLVLSLCVNKGMVKSKHFLCHTFPASMWLATCIDVHLSDWILLFSYRC